MKNKKNKYTNEPIETIKLIADFLPSPDQMLWASVIVSAGTTEARFST